MKQHSSDGSSVDTSWIVEPFVQQSGSGYYNPITGRSSSDADLIALDRDAPVTDPARSLRDAGWIVDAATATPNRYHLRFASIETFSMCNQACNFCPVSVAPRPKMLMSQAHFERVVEDLVSFRDTLEGVFLNFYNEPTIDPLFMDRVRVLKKARLKIALLTNATGLTRKRQQDIRALGGVDFLSVNLNSLDRDRYRLTRGHDHLRGVLPKIDALATSPISADQVINVLGDGGDSHSMDSDAIADRYADTTFETRPFVANSRCGQCGPADVDVRPLAGCEQMGSRLFNHLHVLANGNCVVCCQDYYERHTVGNVFDESVHLVMSGSAMASLRLQAHGLIPAEPDLLCRRCDFALHEDTLPT